MSRAIIRSGLTTATARRKGLVFAAGLFLAAPRLTLKRDWTVQLAAALGGIKMNHVGFGQGQKHSNEFFDMHSI